MIPFPMNCSVWKKWFGHFQTFSQFPEWMESWERESYSMWYLEWMLYWNHDWETNPEQRRATVESLEDSSLAMAAPLSRPAWGFLGWPVLEPDCCRDTRWQELSRCSPTQPLLTLWHSIERKYLAGNSIGTTFCNQWKIKRRKTWW